MRIALLILVAFCTSAIATIRTAGSGGTHVDVAAAFAVCNNTDTVRLVSNVVEDSRADIPWGSNDIWVDLNGYVWQRNGGNELLKFDGHHCHIINGTIIDSSNAASYHSLIFSELASNVHDNFIDNVRITNIGGTIGRAGLIISRDNATFTDTNMTMTGCKIDSMVIAAEGYYQDKAVTPKAYYYNCEFYNTEMALGYKCEFTYNRIIVPTFYSAAPYENQLAGDSILMQYNYVQGNRYTGELFTSDSTSGTIYRLYGVRILDNKLIGNGHVAIVADDAFGWEIARNVIDIGDSISAIYGHNHTRNDTAGYNISIHHNIIGGARAGTGGNIRWVGTSGGSLGTWRMSIRNNIFYNGDGLVQLDSVRQDTVAGARFTSGTVALTSISSITDTARNYPASRLTDTAYGYSFLKLKAPIADTAYHPYGKVVRYDTTGRSETAFSVRCTLSTALWRDYPLAKDSANIVLQRATDTAGTITRADSTSVVKAGATDVLTAGSLSAGTKYFWRLVVLETDGNLRDTSAWDTVRTEGGATPRLTRWYVDTAGSDVTGDGSVGDPLASIARAVDSAIAGDTISINGGRYTEQRIGNATNGVTGTSGAHITVMATNGDTVYVGAGITEWPGNLDADPIPAFELSQKAYWDFVGPMVVDSGFRSNIHINDDNENPDSIKTCHHITFTNVTARNVWGSSNSGCVWIGIISDHNDSMAQSIVFTGCTFSGIIDTVNGGDIRTGGIYSEWWGSGTVRNCTFSNTPIGIHQKQENKVGSTQIVLVENNTFTNHSFRGMLLRGASYWNINNNLFNRVTNTANDAIAIQLFDNDTGYCKVDSNTISHITILNSDQGINLHQGDNYPWPRYTTMKNILIYQYRDGLRAFGIWDYSGQDSSHTALHNSMIYSDLANSNGVYHLSTYYAITSLPTSISPRTGNLYDRPIFTDSSAGNFQITAASPGYRVADDGYNIGFTDSSESGSVPQYTMTNANSGHGTFTPPTGLHDSGSTFNLTYYGVAGYRFYEYNRSNTNIILSDSSSPTSTAEMRANGTITLVDTILHYTVTYNGNGSTGGSVATATYDTGATATAAANGFTRTGYTFTGWNTAANGSGTSRAPGATFTMSANDTLYAQWSLNTYTLTVTHTGSGAIDPDGQVVVDSNAATAITATAAANNHFLRWSVTSGTATITDASSASTTVRCHSNATVSAAFGPDTHHLAYTITGGNAAVTFLGDSIAAYNESITCTLTVLPGYTADWPGGHVGAGKHPLTVVMTQDSTLAITTQERPEYTVDTTWGGYLSAWTVTGGLTHDSGTTVTMTATCDACSSFSGYTGDYTGANRNGSFVITGNVSIGAGCEYGTCASGTKRSPFGFIRSFRFGWR